MQRRHALLATLFLLALIPGVVALAQVGGARWLAVPVEGDPGISWMVVTEAPGYRVLRVFARPGAVRRMHHHADATWHTLTVATGQLVLTVEGQPPVTVVAGQSLSLAGGVNHTFSNPGTETATLVEVFGMARR